MSDPRNVAHDKKVKQEKEHHEPPAGAGGKPKKSRKKAAASEPEEPTGNGPAVTESAQAEQAPGELEKSMAVLSKLKEMEFHARANIETLAGLILTIEEELKQKDFAEPMTALYSAQDSFRTQIAALIEKYEALTKAG